MFGCWRRIDAADPDTFIAAVSAVLSRYPADVVSRVTDPRTGLPGKHPFPPSAYEVRQACEAEMAPVYRQREREARLTAPKALPAPEKPRPTLDELKAMLGPNWGIESLRVRDVSFLTDAEERSLAEERLVSEFLAANPGLSKADAETALAAVPRNR